MHPCRHRHGHLLRVFEPLTFPRASRCANQGVGGVILGRVTDDRMSKPPRNSRRDGHKTMLGIVREDRFLHRAARQVNRHLRQWFVTENGGGWLELPRFRRRVMAFRLGALPPGSARS